MQHYRLYNVNNNKKSDVRGFWQDNGKTYIDNIHISKYSRRRDLLKGIKGLFGNGEKAVFYTEGGQATIQDITGKKTILTHKEVYRRVKLSTCEIKGLLHDFGGVTIYNAKKSRGLYYIETWKK